MPIQSKNFKNLATLIKNNIGHELNDDSTQENNAALNNNSAVMRFLNNKINTRLNIEISKSKCSTYKKGIENKVCHNCVGKCADYYYIKEISKRIIKKNG